MSLQYGELRPTSDWDRFVSLGHPSEFQRFSRLASVTARYSGSGRQPNFAVLNRGHHLCSAGRPSRWALAHILVLPYSFLNQNNLGHRLQNLNRRNNRWQNNKQTVWQTVRAWMVSWLRSFWSTKNLTQHTAKTVLQHPNGRSTGSIRSQFTCFC